MADPLPELATRCRLLLDIIGRSPEPTQGGLSVPELVSMMRGVVDECESSGSLRELRALARDLEEMGRELQPQLRAEVDTLLAADGGGNLAQRTSAELAKVTAVAARGSIGGPAEHELLRGWFDNRPDEVDAKLLEQIERLIYEYEARND